MTRFVPEKDRSHSKNTTPVSAPLVRGLGARVFDADGKEYLDCCSQTLNLNLGHSNPEIEATVIEQIKKLTFSSSRFSSEPATRLAHKLIEITPQSLCKINLKSTSGSCANECAIKAARKKTGKTTIFSLLHSHHGQTTEMMRISGKHLSSTYLGKRGAVFLPPPIHTSDSNAPTSDIETVREDLETLWELHSEDVAAVIIEPVMVDAGVIVPSKGYLEELRSFCTTHDVALIFDEVQTGFGWLGSLHAMDYFSVVPDIVSFGKGLGAGFPLAATLMTESFDVLDYGEHEFTYGAHPISCAVSLKMIEILQQPGFLETVNSKSALIEAGLESLKEKCPIISEIRGVGFIWGIDIKVQDAHAQIGMELVARLLEKGVIMRTSSVGGNSNVLQFKPPLVIENNELDQALSNLEDVLSSY